MRALILASAFLSAACNAQSQPSGDDKQGAPAAGSAASAARPFEVAELADFSEPWAMAFIPGSGQALITEKKGRLLLWTEGGSAVPVAGIPKVDYGGQGGFGDVVLHPGFATNGFVYLSWIEAGQGNNRGAVVGRARLVREGGAPRLDNLQVIWRQQPKRSGRGHYATASPSRPTATCSSPMATGRNSIRRRT